MGRRTFLKTLASLGVSIALPVSLATAASDDVDEANEIAHRNGWTIRFVYEGLL